jgi:hypothetical protein
MSQITSHSGTNSAYGEYNIQLQNYQQNTVHTEYVYNLYLWLLVSNGLLGHQLWILTGTSYRTKTLANLQLLRVHKNGPQ